MCATLKTGFIKNLTPEGVRGRWTGHFNKINRKTVSFNRLDVI